MIIWLFVKRELVFMGHWRGLRGFGASRLNLSKRRVEMLELNARLFGREVPVGGSMFAVAKFFPGSNFPDEGYFIGDAPIEALFG